MDEIVYNLLLKNRAGLLALGQLRYRLRDFGAEAVDAGGPTLLARPELWKQQQDQPRIGVAVFRAEGTLTVPLLTGWQAVPVSGVAYFVLIGPPLWTYLATESGQTLVSFNQVNTEQIGGGLLREPGQQAFALLGRRPPLPA